MNIVISRILPDDVLSRFRIRDMRPDEIIVATCDTVAEFNSAKRNADNVRKEPGRMDGYLYRIESDSTRNTIKVSLYKDERKEVIKDED